MSITGRCRHRIWLLAMLLVLLAPSPATLAESAARDSLVITASVSSLIVADISGVSSKCTLLQPDKHDHGKDKKKHDHGKDHHGKGSKHGSSWRSSFSTNHGSKNNPVYCVLKLPYALHVLSNEQWSVTLKAVDTGSTREPSVKACSLRYSSTKPTSYRDAAAAPIVGSTPTSWLKNQSAGERTTGLYLILTSPDKTKIASFSAKLTLTLTQKISGLQYSIIVPVTFRAS